MRLQRPFSSPAGTNPLPFMRIAIYMVSGKQMSKKPPVQKSTVAVTNSGLKDGKVKISNGKAKLTDTEGLLRVSFFGPFYSDYRVMMLSEDYNYALVGSGSSKYLWILSGFPEVPDDILNRILDEAVRRGYTTDKLIWVPQKCFL